MSTEISEQTKQAFASAADWSKQILTLSTAIVTLTVTFSKDVFSDVASWEKLVLWLAWTAFLVAILAGILMLGALTGALASSKVPLPTTVNNSALMLFSRAQLGAFAAGVFLIVVFGFAALGA